MAFDIQNYTTVQERVAEFYTRFPDGSIQFEYMGIMEGDPTKMWGVARAYRSPEDVLPGIGTASEFIIGKTPYTLGSELQNLETSCWGRSLASLNIGTSKSLSSKEEVVGSRERQAPGPAVKTVAPRQVVEESFPIPPEPVFEDEPETGQVLDPWSLEVITNVPHCDHGPMDRRNGISKKTGKPYAGYFCNNEPQCPPIFDRS